MNFKTENNTSEAINLKMESDVLKSITYTSAKGKLWIALLLVIFIAGLIAYGIQLKNGLIVTSMRNYVSWGLYISMFIFFIGISHVGALMSSILRLTGAEWRFPITRMAEAITFSSLLFAGIMPILDMGRPDRLLFLFTHGRIQSPILWDIIAIATYFVGSTIYLYLPMIPDIAMLRDKLANASRWRKKFYRALAVGWKGTDVQKQLLEKCMNIMTAIILPIAISVHTVVAWLLAMTLRTGWNSTILGPYFVSAAIMSGAASVLIAMAIFRKAYKLEQYITIVHFKNLSLLLFVLTLIYAYFNINEYGVPAYKMERAEHEYLNELFYGAHAPLYWSVQILGLLVPLILLAFKRIRNSIGWIVFVSALIVTGAMIKRYIIVVPTMLHPFVPIQKAPVGYGSYFPSMIEWFVTLGAMAGFMLVYTLFSKLFPIITLWETSDAIKNNGAVSVGVHLQISSTVSS